MPSTAPSRRSEIQRKAERAHYDAASIRAIIDAAFLCHIAFADQGSVHCLPTACWRDGDFLYIHGAPRSRMTQALLAGECAVTLTHLDGLVLARSAFRHSMNYRSVVIYGQFAAVDAPEEQAMAMTAFLEHVSPGRSPQVRPPSPAELASTRLLRLPLAEASAKIRNWGVEDSPPDRDIAVWAGVLPLACQAGAARPEAGSEAYRPPQLPAALGQPAPATG